MKPLIRHTGRAVVLGRDDVDTDQIVPAEFCKRLTKTGYADALFANWRKAKDFPLEAPAAQGASVLVAGRNFGTGSSREHAVWALRDGGFTVVVASSYGDIFYRNAFKNGLLAVALPPAAIVDLVRAVTDDATLTVTADVETRELRAAGLSHEFPLDDHARYLLLNGLDDIALSLRHQSVIKRYEEKRPTWLPSLRPGMLSGATASVEAL